MKGYSLQTTDTNPSIQVGDDMIKWLGHFGDIYTDSEAFIKLVNTFIFDNYYEDIEEVEEPCEDYYINEKILNNIKVGDYYLIYHTNEEEISYIIVCHNIVIM